MYNQCEYYFPADGRELNELAENHHLNTAPGYAQAQDADARDDALDAAIAEAEAQDADARDDALDA